MEAFVTTGLVLKETRYKESDRILTILKQIVQRLRAVLLFRVYAGAGPQHVYRAGSRSEKRLSRHFGQH